MERDQTISWLIPFPDVAFFDFIFWTLSYGVLWTLSLGQECPSLPQERLEL
jgi:hypothetical protein